MKLTPGEGRVLRACDPWGWNAADTLATQGAVMGLWRKGLVELRWRPCRVSREKELVNEYRPTDAGRRMIEELKNER